MFVLYPPYISNTSNYVHTDLDEFFFFFFFLFFFFSFLFDRSLELRVMKLISRIISSNDDHISPAILYVPPLQPFLHLEPTWEYRNPIPRDK